MKWILGLKLEQIQVQMIIACAKQSAIAVQMKHFSNNNFNICVLCLRYADLNQFLRNARGTPRRHQTISTRQLVNFAVQISCGMEHLASMKYVHRDLSTRNCM